MEDILLGKKKVLQSHTNEKLKHVDTHSKAYLMIKEKDNRQSFILKKIHVMEARKESKQWQQPNQ